MAGGAINIQIGGNAQQLSQAAAQASASLAGLNNAANAAAAGLGNAGTAAGAAGRGLGLLARYTPPSIQGLTLLGNAANNAGRGLGSLPGAANTATAGLTNAATGAGRATFALTNLGRVAQDAPFGLIGIANNLEPLVTSFISLRRESGSAGGALRALGSSLLGPGGLILGIGLLSTVASLAGQGLFTAAKEADKFGEAMSKANEEAGKEIAQLRIAAAVASDTTRSTTERTTAAKELQAQLKENNVTLSQEAILNGQVASAIDQATKAILERAKARAIENRIAELTAQNLDREIKRPAALQKFLTLQKQLTAERAKSNQIAGAPSTVSPETAGFATAARNELIALDQATLDATAEINKLLQLVKDEDITPKFDSAKAAKDVDLLKQRIAALKELQSLTGLDTAQQIQLAQLEIQLANRDSIKAGFTADELQQQIDGIIEKAFPVKTFEFKLNKVAIVPKTVSLAPNINVGAAVLPNGIANNAFDGVIKAIQDNATTRLAQFQLELAERIRSTLLNAFIEGVAGIGESLGNTIGALINGESVGQALAAAGEGILKTVGGVLQDIGKQVIATSALVQALKKSLATLFANPTAALGVGIGLVALGSLLKSIKLSGGVTPGFADGIDFFAGGRALVGERGAEIVELPRGASVTPLSPFAGDQLPLPSLFARGDDLYLTYNRTASRRRRV